MRSLLLTLILCAVVGCGKAEPKGNNVPLADVPEPVMKVAKENGPCCCHCWRWNAFEGQAKKLIARRKYTAPQVARLWGLEDGCGSGSPDGMMG